MGAKAIEAALARHKRIGLDSMTLIYLLEDAAPHASTMELVFQRIEKGRCTAYVSVLGLTELLVRPMELADYETVEKYRHFLLNFPNLQILDLDIPTAEIAASLRAKYSFRTPDAIHLATALQHGASAFLTNDKQLTRLKELDVLLLDSLT